jgi:hypothetical protein
MAELTLTEFLTARLDEDEAMAKAADEDWAPSAALPRDTHLVYGLEHAGFGLAYQGFALVHDPARVLREVAAKRAILMRYADCLTRTEDAAYPNGVAMDQVREYDDFVLPNLAAIWSDHHDYRPEWATGVS